MRGKVHAANFFRNLDKEEHPNILIAKSAKGWMDGMEWLRRIYSRKLISPAERRVLTLDGHSSHMNEQFIGFRESHNVALLCLPPHSTHPLQPLDVGPFRLYYGIGIDVYFREIFGFALQHLLPISPESLQIG